MDLNHGRLPPLHRAWKSSTKVPPTKYQGTKVGMCSQLSVRINFVIMMIGIYVACLNEKQFWEHLNFGSQTTLEELYIKTPDECTVISNTTFARKYLGTYLAYYTWFPHSKDKTYIQSETEYIQQSPSRMSKARSFPPWEKTPCRQDLARLSYTSRYHSFWLV